LPHAPRRRIQRPDRCALPGERLDEAIDLEARLRLARRLILAGVALAETAASAGFADQSHLNRAFRKLMGTSPGRWARQMRR